ncbi:hypothetical protein PYW08_011346 [Mythimna loreyi]|uniref:Uncharacterized protein n=1 Tax=Mythimna loreyi TaxID=667449 RepID=A0ACC2Q339_9NEOP|nr:hypothetical protein PYW08_011346 [Mythimna loreyi]
MSSFTVLLLCIQACLVQNVFSQACLGTYAPAPAPVLASPIKAPCGLAAPGLSAPLGWASGLAYDGLAFPAGAGYGAAAYGGSGEGNVAVAGELPVAGNTAVAGQVPIMGVVNFGGAVPAAGCVSISGNCACGCDAPINYWC